jgi:hypothetical protein
MGIAAIHFQQRSVYSRVWALFSSLPDESNEVRLRRLFSGSRLNGYDRHFPRSSGRPVRKLPPADAFAVLKLQLAAWR